MAYDTPSSTRALSPKLIAIAVFGLLAFSVLSGSFYTVEQGNIGIKLRFGALVEVEEPGVGFKLPFIDAVLPMSARTEKIAFPPLESYSKDIQAATLQISVNYHIDRTQAGNIYSTLGLNYADRIIIPNTLRMTKEVFGQFNAQNIIIERASLAKQIETKLADAMLPHGVILESFQLEDVEFSHAFEQSIEARMQAEVEVARLRQNLEREKVQADIQRTQAIAAADATRSTAQAEADSITLRGMAEAKTIQARGEALRANPEMIALTQAERWNGVLPTTMLPSGALPMINLARDTTK